jgi:hypothetical protein
MDLLLVNTEFRADGVFGELRDMAGDVVVYTLQHSYADSFGGFQVKIPDGVYQCVRGFHQLEGMTEPFETFEVTNVPGHAGILFHVGNFNSDSTGCVLVGMGLATISDQQALSQSKIAFQKFMGLQNAINNFTLTVKSS